MGKPITEDEVRGLFSLWNNALATEDPKKVAERYAKAGVLLPTVSDVPRTDFASIEDYFVNFLKLKPQGEILESHVTVGQNWCQDAGIYEVSFSCIIVCKYLVALIAYTHTQSLPSYDSLTTSVHHGCHRKEGQGPLLLHLRIRGWRVEDQSPPLLHHAGGHRDCRTHHREGGPWLVQLVE